MSKTHLLTKKTCVVTGATRGLGRAIAEAFVDEGADVFIVGRDKKTVAQTCTELNDRAQRDAVTGLGRDLCDSTCVGSIFDSVEERFGGLPHVVVNSAGYFVWRKLDDVTDEDWDRSLELQLTVPFRIIRAFSRRWAGRAHGGSASIINIGSIHGVVGDRHAVPQCSAKAGVLGLTRASAESLRERGVRVNAIVPGSIAQESSERLSIAGDDLVTQGDVAQLAVFLASDRASGITGSIFDAFGATRPVIAKPG